MLSPAFASSFCRIGLAHYPFDKLVLCKIAVLIELMQKQMYPRYLVISATNNSIQASDPHARTHRSKNA